MAKFKQAARARGPVHPHNPTPTVNVTKKRPSVAKGKVSTATANGSSPAVAHWYNWTTELVSRFLNDYKFSATHKAFQKERKVQEKALGPHKASEVKWPKDLPELPFLVNLWVSGQLGAPLSHDAVGHDHSHDGLRDEMDGDGEGSTMDKQGQESATVPTARVLTSGQPDTAELGSTSESSESTAGSDSEQSSADGQTLQAEVNEKPRGESATSTVRKVEASLSKTTPRDESPDSSESSDSSDSSESSESGGDAVANGQASSSADSSSDDTSSQDEKEISTADRKELHAKPSALSRKHKKSKAKDTVVDEPSSSESDADPPGPVSGHDAPATTPKKRKKPHSSPTNEVQERSKKARHSSGGAEQAPRSNGKAQNNRPFRRVAADEPVDEKFQSNAYVPYDYADRAHRDLAPTKGKNFTKEKNKKKRGSYRGGAIDVHGKKGIKFDD